MSPSLRLQRQQQICLFPSYSFGVEKDKYVYMLSWFPGSSPVQFSPVFPFLLALSRNSSVPQRKVSNLGADHSTSEEGGGGGGGVGDFEKKYPASAYA